MDGTDGKDNGNGDSDDKGDAANGSGTDTADSSGFVDSGTWDVGSATPASPSAPDAMSFTGKDAVTGLAGISAVGAVGIGAAIGGPIGTMTGTAIGLGAAAISQAYGATPGDVLEHAVHDIGVALERGMQEQAISGYNAYSTTSEAVAAGAPDGSGSGGGGSIYGGYDTYAFANSLTQQGGG